MNASTFKKGLVEVLTSNGFVRFGKSLRRDDKNVTILISFENGFGQQWFINVGFWLIEIGDLVPEIVQKSHLYFRIERLFPENREIILTAGALDDVQQPIAFNELEHLLRDKLISSICKLASKENLKSALSDGRLAGIGLITKEARECLGV